MENLKKLIREEMALYLEGIHLSLSEEQLNKFTLFCDLLIEKNKVMNLTAITEPKEIVLKHFIDSLCVCPTDYLKNVNTIIDVGTGAGFPGLPLSIVYPDISFTLLDSLKKRITFIDEVCERCNIRNVKTYHGRAEDYGHNSEFREKYDICVSRAVANLSTLLEYCTPFIKVGGKFIAYKSGKVEEEILNSESAMKKLNIELRDKYEFQLPLSDMQRTFLEIVKIEKTNMVYPRSAGKPSKKPL